MDTFRKAAFLIGTIMLLQLLSGPTVNFVLMGPVEAAPGFLANAAAHSTAVALAVIIAVAMALLSLGIPVLAWPILQRCSPAASLLFLVLGIVNCSTDLAEQTASLSMLTLSQKSALAPATDAGLFQGLGYVVGSAHKWAHYMNLIMGGVSMSLFYAVLLRFALIPRALAGFGLLAALLLLYAVGAPLFGQTINFLLLAPVGLAQLSVSLWLLIRGFAASDGGRVVVPA